MLENFATIANSFQTQEDVQQNAHFYKSLNVKRIHTNS